MLRNIIWHMYCSTQRYYSNRSENQVGLYLFTFVFQTQRTTRTAFQSIGWSFQHTIDTHSVIHHKTRTGTIYINIYIYITYCSRHQHFCQILGHQHWSITHIKPRRTLRDKRCRRVWTPLKHDDQVTIGKQGGTYHIYYTPPLSHSRYRGVL